MWAPNFLCHGPCVWQNFIHFWHTLTPWVSVNYVALHVYNRHPNIFLTWNLNGTIITYKFLCAAKLYQLFTKSSLVMVVWILLYILTRSHATDLYRKMTAVTSRSLKMLLVTDRNFSKHNEVFWSYTVSYRVLKTLERNLPNNKINLSEVIAHCRVVRKIA